MTAREEAEKIVDEMDQKTTWQVSIPEGRDRKLCEQLVFEALEARDKIIAGCVLQLDSLTDLPTTQKINVKVFLQYLKDKGYA